MTTRASLKTAALLSGLLTVTSAANAAEVVIANDYMQVRVDGASGQLVGWQICAQRCQTGTDSPSQLEIVSGKSILEIAPTNSERRDWRVELAEPKRLRLTRPSAQNADRRETREFEITGRYQLRVHIISRPNRQDWIRVGLPESFHREPGHGFAGSQEKVFPVEIRDGQLTSVPPVGSGSPATVSTFGPSAAQQWVGFRNRFWAFVASAEPGEAGWQYEPGTEGQPARWEIQPTTATSTIHFYSGPLTSASLTAADPVLRELMFGHLWSWLRWLCLGVLWLLDTLHSLVGSWGLAVVALSLVVKVIMSPLNALAQRWQRQVNVIQSRLQPTVDAIKRDYKGEEQANRILAAHKEVGVTPFYTMKGLAGLFFLIPVFLAAYHTLGHAVGLNGASFLWIDDLARPDAFMRLPFTVPFFGDHLNLLPVLMTLVTVFASWASRDDSLSEKLLASRRRRLYGMAFVFFILFYTFPAGMVLYWTMNTVFQHVGDLLTAHRRRHALAATDRQGD